MNGEYIAASLGGLMIGVSAILMLGLLGKITGISGIFWQAISNNSNLRFSDNSWRWFFLSGLLLGPIVVHNLFGMQTPMPSDAGSTVAILAGLLVGFGVKLGSGCTSGHGICGIARFSKRSSVATIVFMFTGVITVLAIRHLL